MAIKWTIVGRVAGAAFWGQTETFDTKRAAVKAMMLVRQPKTPIVRDGHGFVYILPSK